MHWDANNLYGWAMGYIKSTDDINVMYWDANNLYGWAMGCNYLPYHIKVLNF